MVEAVGVTEAALGDVDVGRGLSAAQVAQRVAAGEVNKVADRSGRSVADIVRANVFTRINAILAVLFALVVVTGSLINGLFALLIVANSAIGIIQEIRAKRTLDRLAIVGQAQPVVRRDGASAPLPADQVVRDDIIELGPGDQAVVDGVVVESAALEMDESLLTGESDPVDKAVGRDIFSGSFAASGSGAYRATKIGSQAYAARLAGEAGAFTLVNSELMNGINRILKVITWLLIPAGVLTIFNQLFVSNNGFRASLLGMVAALVPMVPEGLVLMTSIAFAVGVVRLGQRQCLVNELPAIEGLARVDIVCADKTGTLTENGMRVSEVDPLDGYDKARVSAVFAALAAHDPRPNASVQALAESFTEAPDWSTTAIAPFSSAKKWSGMSFRNKTSGSDEGNWLLGAPDVLLDSGSVVAQHATDLGETGLRVLLLARTDVAVDTASPESAPTPGHVEPVALVALEQRVRPDARDTLDYFARQHVEVKVISGDNAVSVGAVAESLGLGTVAESVDARTLSTEPDELAGEILGGVTFGRVKPDQKRAIVGALQARGHTVAMTGDGVNDVLALKDSDIGVAMGSGSSAARSVAQIVLLDNKFATLPYVVGEGRRVIGNIERVANLFLTKTVYAVVLALLVGVGSLGSKAFGHAAISYPFLPIHVTISAWFTIGVPAFVLSLAPNNERAREGFVRRVLQLAIPSGIIVAVCTFVAYLLVYPGGGGPALGSDAKITLSTPQMQAATTALITMIAVAWYVLVVVARPYTWWKLVLLAGCALGYVLVFTLPLSRHMFSLDPSNGHYTVIAFVCAAVGMVCVEVASRIGMRRIARAEGPLQ